MPKPKALETAEALRKRRPMSDLLDRATSGDKQALNIVKRHGDIQDMRRRKRQADPRYYDPNED